MMKANITYAYTIELGPTEHEADEHADMFFGFHVAESKLADIVQIAYTGIEAYMRSFLEKIDRKTQTEIDRICENEYKELMNTYNGYWS